MTEKDIRVRYAPSPTGHLHIGNARTAIFNWLYTRHFNGTFVIRIEDTDTARNVEDGEKSQLDNLAWLGIDWDEGPDKPNSKYAPYRQSERNNQGIYQKYINELLEKGIAYKSYKTPEQLNVEREAQQAAKQAPHYIYEYEGLTNEERENKYQEYEAQGLKPVIRIHVSEDVVYKWDDIVKGKMEIASKEIGGDWVIQKADGMPTYNFAVVVDDHLMDITHVLRGDDHVSNTPKQIGVYNALGWDVPKFGHMTLIINTETGKKLSKRDESILQFIEQYKELGYLPEAMINFIGLLGWSPVGEDEIFTKEEFVNMFDPKRLSKAPAKFDAKKLQWVNNQWIRKSLDSVIPKLADELVKAGVATSGDYQNRTEWYKKMFEIAGVDGIAYTQEIVPLATYPFFKLPEMNNELREVVSSDVAKQLISDFAQQLTNLQDVSADNVMSIIRSLQTEQLRGRDLWNPLRVAITRAIQGPNLPEIVALMGKEWTLKNINDL
ncbi:MAG: glutamate--tRNA ligase [Lactobacillaceae bacterium]|jgi:nondiscriminating glutamyl-tRNA synthetase|nr:glutamate--tRNA ligase [Lactobacillaceae bacterium]